MHIGVFSRWVRMLGAASLAFCLAWGAAAHAGPDPHAPAAGLLASIADSSSAAAAQSSKPDDFVRVQNGKFVLHGNPFVMRGINYFGSWRINTTIQNKDGDESHIPWGLYHDWNPQAIDADFRFIRAHLNATVVRIGTPGSVEFEKLVRTQHFEPWYNSDGTITDKYRSELIRLADIAYANGVRIQYSLIWHLKVEIRDDPDEYKAGGRMDTFYANHVRSIASALRDHPGVVAYSIGNETLEICELNCKHPSWFEGEAAGFMVRRMQDIRAVAPRQLLTADETVPKNREHWYYPGKTLISLPGVDLGHGGQNVRVADTLDYLGPHFYPETLESADLNTSFGSKIDEAKGMLDEYMRAASALGKPIVIDEFGLRTAPEIFRGPQLDEIRARFFQAVIAEGRSKGLQGLLAWNALPEIALIPNHYEVRASGEHLKPNDDPEIDIDSDHTQHRILHYKSSYNLFEWRGNESEPGTTKTSDVLASSWPEYR